MGFLYSGISVKYFFFVPSGPNRVLGAFWLIFGLEMGISEKFTFKIQFFGINLHFDLLDHQVDILSNILRPKFFM